MQTGPSDPSARAPDTSRHEPELLDTLRTEVDLRLQALTRLREMNLKHAAHAWRRRYSDPLSPYGLAFLYVQPGHDQRWHTLLTGTKLWLAGPEASNLPRLLFDLNVLIEGRHDDATFDPRRDLANRVDEGMAQDAWYVGLGVSSLDTYSGTWAEACAQVNRDGDLPGTIRIVMIDSTIMACERRGVLEFNGLTIRSTRPLTATTMDSMYSWDPTNPDAMLADPQHGQILQWMGVLHHNLWLLDNARLVRQREAEGHAD
jgi:hypothetical protein